MHRVHRRVLEDEQARRHLGAGGDDVVDATLAGDERLTIAEHPGEVVVPAQRRRSCTSRCRRPGLRCVAGGTSPKEMRRSPGRTCRSRRRRRSPSCRTPLDRLWPAAQAPPRSIAETVECHMGARWSGADERSAVAARQRCQDGQMLAYLPSPSSGAIHLGPLQLRGLWADDRPRRDRRGVARVGALGRASGGNADDIVSVATMRRACRPHRRPLYHVITDYQLLRGPLVRRVRHLGGRPRHLGRRRPRRRSSAWIVARRRRHPLPPLLDVRRAGHRRSRRRSAAWGNWFNQELFGRPTDAAVGAEIDVAHRPDRYVAVHHVPPDVPLRVLWNLAVVGIVLLRRPPLPLAPGRPLRARTSLATVRSLLDRAACASTTPTRSSACGSTTGRA